MTKHLGLVVWVAGALVLAAAGACSNSSDDPSGSPSSTTSTQTPPASSSAPSPSATSATDQAAAEASATLRRYFAVTDQLGQAKGADLGALAKVATGTQLKAERTLLEGQRTKKQRQVGDTRVSELTVQSVNLDNSAPALGKVPTVVIDVCWDVGDVDVVDAAGKSIISPERPDVGWTRYTIANYRWAENPDGGWRVANGQDLKQAPCAAS